MSVRLVSHSSLLHCFLAWQTASSALYEKVRSPYSAHHRCDMLLSSWQALGMAVLSSVTFLFAMFLKERALKVELTQTIPFFLFPPRIPVRAARSQKVFIWMEFYNVHWASMSCKLKHHLPSSQIPQLEEGKNKRLLEKLMFKNFKTLWISLYQWSSNTFPPSLNRLEFVKESNDLEKEHCAGHLRLIKNNNNKINN